MGDANVQQDGTVQQRADGGFRLGLALSGAISAGAYTAGVIDFLVEALEAWESARGDPNTPQHRAGLKVVTGASAGSITGAIGLIALARGPEAQELSAKEVAASLRTPGKDYNPNRCVLQPLYEAWVEKPQLMADKRGTSDFLSLSDLNKKAGVASLLNSTLLDEIKELALKGTGKPVTPRPYLASSLHLYMTVSNLRGIPFSLDFGEGKYGMLTHGDRLHYKITGLGGWEGKGSPWLDKDIDAKELNAAELPVKAGDKIPADWDVYGTVALASSAFPVGLASRELTNPYKGYHARAYPIDAEQDRVITPSFPGIAADFGGDYKFLNVDGGLINNNPYDYAEYALLGIPQGRGSPLKDPQAEGKRTTAAVVMVSPFPEPPAYLPEGQPKPELAAVLRALLPTLMTQARFRTSDLVKAMDPRDYKRFLIAPHRKVPVPGSDKEQEAEFRIACGALGGFGGFLDRSFRAHDYQLGRRNCQQFLRQSLGLPVGADAKIVDDKEALRIAATANREERTPIIPLLGHAQLEVALPPWPRIPGDTGRLEARIEARLKKLLPALVATVSPRLSIKWTGWFAQRFLRSRIQDTIKWMIVSDLVLRDQITGWELPASLERDGVLARRVLAALAAPGFDFRTKAGLARTIRMPEGDERKPEEAIAFVLNELQGAEGNTKVVTASWNDGLFALEQRNPTGPRTWLGIGWLARKWGPMRFVED